MKTNFRIEEFILKGKLKKINEVPCINSGGCGFVAYSVSQYLERKNIPHQIYYLIDSESIYNNLKNGVVDSPPHVLIKVFGKFFDSDGERGNKNEEYTYVEKVSREYLKKALLKPNLWNFMFDRLDSVKIVKILEEK